MQRGTGAPSKKTGAGHYLKLIVRTMKRSVGAFGFFPSAMCHLLSELLHMAARSSAKARNQLSEGKRVSVHPSNWKKNNSVL